VVIAVKAGSAGPYSQLEYSIPSVLAGLGGGQGLARLSRLRPEAWAPTQRFIDSKFEDVGGWGGC
jgi:hypothetical protein